jgi:hypothetical protein
VTVEPPIVNVAPPEVIVPAPVVNVDTREFALAVEALKDAIMQQPRPEPSPVIRREVKRDDAGRIVEIIEHRGS